MRAQPIGMQASQTIGCHDSYMIPWSFLIFQLCNTSFRSTLGYLMPQHHVLNSICGARALQADPRGVFGIWSAKHGRTYLDDLQARTHCASK